MCFIWWSDWLRPTHVHMRTVFHSIKKCWKSPLFFLIRLSAPCWSHPDSTLAILSIVSLKKSPTTSWTRTAGFIPPIPYPTRSREWRARTFLILEWRPMPIFLRAKRSGLELFQSRFTQPLKGESISDITSIISGCVSPCSSKPSYSTSLAISGRRGRLGRWRCSCRRWTFRLWIRTPRETELNFFAIIAPSTRAITKCTPSSSSSVRFW